MNDTELEARLREQLPRLADFAVRASEPSPRLGDVQPQVPARRLRSKVTVLAAAGAVVVVVAIAVAALLPRGSEHRVRSRGTAPDTSVATEPTAPPVHTLTIVATNFHYDAARYVVPPGITELRLVSDEGLHTLVFDQPQFAYVHLAVPGGPTSVKVDLVAGHTYGVFCTLPGHQRAGEVATIAVEAADPGPDATTVPSIPTRP